jgi:hypothetical protein
MVTLRTSVASKLSSAPPVNPSFVLSLLPPDASLGTIARAPSLGKESPNKSGVAVARKSISHPSSNTLGVGSGNIIVLSPSSNFPVMPELASSPPRNLLSPNFPFNWSFYLILVYNFDFIEEPYCNQLSLQSLRESLILINIKTHDHIYVIVAE